MATKTLQSKIDRDLDFIEGFLKDRAYDGEELQRLENIRSGVEELSFKLKEAVEELENTDADTSLANEFRGNDTIEWRASNMADIQMMEALAEALEKLTPNQIAERLKVY